MPRAKPVTDYRAVLAAKWNYRPVAKVRLRARRRPGDHETVWDAKAKRHVPYRHGEEALEI